MYNTGHLGIASLSSVMYTIRFWLGSHRVSLRTYRGIQTDGALMDRHESS